MDEVDTNLVKTDFKFLVLARLNLPQSLICFSATSLATYSNISNLLYEVYFAENKYIKNVTHKLFNLIRDKL